MPGELFQRYPGRPVPASPPAACRTVMRCRNQTAERMVAAALVPAMREYNNTSGVPAAVVLDCQVHADYRINPRCQASLEVLDRSVQSVPVRAGQSVRSEGSGGAGQLIRPGDTVVGAERRGYMQMGKAHWSFQTPYSRHRIVIRQAAAKPKRINTGCLRSGAQFPDGIMDTDQSPAIGIHLMGKIQGADLGPAVQPCLNTPDFMVHQPGAPAPLCAQFFRPPFAAFIPTHRFCDNPVAPALPPQPQRLSGRGTNNVDSFTENTHVPVTFHLDNGSESTACAPAPTRLQKNLTLLFYSNMCSNPRSSLGAATDKISERVRPGGRTRSSSPSLARPGPSHRPPACPTSAWSARPLRHRHCCLATA